MVADTVIWVIILCSTAIAGILGLAFGVVKDQRDALRIDLADAREKLAEAEVTERLLRTSGAELSPRAPWQKQRLMNGSEFRVFCDLQKLVRQGSQQHRLFSQVSYGAFLDVPGGAKRSRENSAAYFAVARKCADFLLIDRRGFPVAVLEYQGADHFQGNADDRDQAKRVACRKAGVLFIEVPPEGLTVGQRRDLYDLLVPAPSLAAE